MASGQPGGNKKNLVPLTTEKARLIGAMGGKKSGEVKKQRKMLSIMYSDLLAKEFDIDIAPGKKTRMTAEKYFAFVISRILDRTDSASVSMLKEIREATEGRQLKLSGHLDHTVTNALRNLSDAELLEMIDEEA